MDLLKAEILKKRKALEDAVNLEQKTYFRRADLLAKEEEERKKIIRCLKEDDDSSNDSQSKRTDPVDDNDEEKSEKRMLPRKEVIKRLRERCEPILLFGESDLQAFQRLRKCEILEPEVNKGLRNDFQEALDRVDQAFLDEIVKSQQETGEDEDVHTVGPSTSDMLKKKSSFDVVVQEDGVTYEDIKSRSGRLGRGDKELDRSITLDFLQLILKLWGQQLNDRAQAEKRGVKGKLASATFSQTHNYLKPLFRKLKNKTLPEDILDSLTDIIRFVLDRNYIKANDAYLEMAIGNAPWPIGVTMVGIHARTGREKIFSKNVAHVLNDETQRKYIQGLKRLMTRAQILFPTDPSRCVEYAAFT